MSNSNAGAERKTSFSQKSIGEKSGQRPAPLPGGIFRPRSDGTFVLPRTASSQAPVRQPSTPAFLPSTGPFLPETSGAPAPESLPSTAKNRAAVDDSPALGNTRDLPPSLGNTRDLPPSLDPYREKIWGLFFGMKKRGWYLYGALQEEDKNHPWLKILKSSAFACRCGAAYRAGDDDVKAVSLGYANGEMAWLGTYKCGSARFCPICGAAISMKNQKEVEQGIKNAIAKGFSCLLVTKTFPHRKTQAAMELEKNFSQARNLSNKGGDLSRFMKKMGYLGTITRQEETYGENGWHPHTHELLFFDHFLSDGEIAEVGAKLKQKWTDACFRLGLVPEKKAKFFDQHGFDLQTLHTPEEIARYISKIGWKDSSEGFKDRAKEAVLEASSDRISGMAYEVASRDSKAPRGAEGRTPWDILEGFAAGNSRDTRLWLEYMEAFFNKPLVRWAPGLKDLLGVKDLEDEEKVKADEKDSISHIYYIEESQYTRGVVHNGLWLPILRAVDAKDFELLQHFADKYAIDFKRSLKCYGDYHEILSIQNDEERQKQRERELADEQRRIDREAREKAAAEAAAEAALVEKARQAKLSAERAYLISLLSPEDARQVREDRQAAKEAARQAKKDAKRLKSA